MQLAEAVNISRTHISNIEAPNVQTSVSLDTLLDISEVLNVNITSLLLQKNKAHTKFILMNSVWTFFNAKTPAYHF